MKEWKVTAEGERSASNPPLPAHRSLPLSVLLKPWRMGPGERWSPSYLPLEQSTAPGPSSPFALSLPHSGFAVPDRAVPVEVAGSEHPASLSPPVLGQGDGWARLRSNGPPRAKPSQTAGAAERGAGAGRGELGGQGNSMWCRSGVKESRSLSLAPASRAEGLQAASSAGLLSHRVGQLPVTGGLGLFVCCGGAAVSSSKVQYPCRSGGQP